MPGSSAPGPDRLPYKVWKAIDPSGSILSKILEICRLHKRIPKSWKESTTILLYKKGDQSVPSNWRPISLQNAVYKIYAALWAKRLASWASEAEIISSCPVRDVASIPFCCVLDGGCQAESQIFVFRLVRSQKCLWVNPS